MTRVGLIVNPAAGMGGSVGLKGTDGVLDEAVRRGAVQSAPQRAVRALAALVRAGGEPPQLITCAAAMGADAAAACGVAPVEVIPVADPSGAGDTRRAAAAMVDAGVGLLLFAGGDGTAADVLAAVGRRVPVLGVPAGVKMHSGVFAQTPERAGMLAARFLGGGVHGVSPREVADIDEDQLRAGVLAPRLLGHLLTPDDSRLLQHAKRRGQSERHALEAIGAAVAAAIPPGALLAVGPGTTAGAVMDRHGLRHTLLGFDLIRDGALVASDVRASDMLAVADELHVVLAPTGGQGSLLGRGTQPLSAAVLARVGPQRLHIVATRDRLAALQGRPLLIDLDDAALARRLSGALRILVAPGHAVVYPVIAPERRDLECAA